MLLYARRLVFHLHIQTCGTLLQHNDRLQRCASPHIEATTISARGHHPFTYT